MKAVDIIKALTYEHPDSGDGIIEFNPEYSMTKDPNEFLDSFFKLGKPTSGEFTPGTWYYIYDNELSWSDYRQRIENHQQTEPDVILEAYCPEYSEPNITVYLYKIDD